MTIRLLWDHQEPCQEPPVLHNPIPKTRGPPIVLTYLEAFLGGVMKAKVVSYDH